MTTVQLKDVIKAALDSYSDVEYWTVTSGSGNVMFINLPNGQEYALHIDENTQD